MGRSAKILTAVAACVVLGVIALCWAELKHNSTWDPKTAAAYLDRREADWSSWPDADTGQQTFCVSCHTTLPYALARPTLRNVTGEKEPAPDEVVLLNDVTKRVRDWNETKPYYGGDMTDRARGTEAVMNALVLASHDKQSGQLSPDTLLAFGHLWETQQTSGDAKGAWLWIQFGNEPWEAQDSVFYGACVAAVAVGMAPGDYRSMPAIQGNIESLREYLIRESAAQPPMNRAAQLWASANLPGLLTATQQKALVDEMLAKQQDDGGWSLASLAGSWKRDDGTSFVEKSDGYATGLIVLSLEEVGIPRSDEHVKKGRAWLARNQRTWGGGWDAYSLNHRRHNPFSMVSQFMNDAATGYAVLALTESTNPTNSVASKDIGSAAQSPQR